MGFSVGRPATETNDLLANLSPDDHYAIESTMRFVRLERGAILSRRSMLPTDVWFPKGGVVSLCFTDNEGRSVQTGIVGREGCIGIEALFPGAPPLAEAVVLIEGTMAAIQAAHLRSAMNTRPAIQQAVVTCLYSIAAESLQTVACNRLHKLEARCCRWLLMIHDRTDDPDLALTQEGLATMLGSGRPRINVLLAGLERDGLLQRARGRILLLSRRKLEARACECYRLLGSAPDALVVSARSSPSAA